MANKFTVVEEKHCTEQMSLLTMYLARKSSFNASIPIAACLFPPFDVTNPKTENTFIKMSKPPKTKVHVSLASSSRSVYSQSSIQYISLIQTSGDTYATFPNSAVNCLADCCTKKSIQSAQIEHRIVLQHDCHSCYFVS